MKDFVTFSMTDTENSSSVANNNKRRRGKSPSKEPPVKKPRKEPKSRAATKRYNYKEVQYNWCYMYSIACHFKFEYLLQPGDKLVMELGLPGKQILPPSSGDSEPKSTSDSESKCTSDSEPKSTSDSKPISLLVTLSLSLLVTLSPRHQKTPH